MKLITAEAVKMIEDNKDFIVNFQLLKEFNKYIRRYCRELSNAKKENSSIKYEEFIWGSSISFLLNLNTHLNDILSRIKHSFNEVDSLSA
jgi:polysaccharide pyruvyl transferase WcaK-like protein